MMDNNNQRDTVIQGLSRLMAFQKSLMKTEDSPSFFFEMVNNSRTILSFQHAVAFERTFEGVEVRGVSGAPNFDHRGPLAGELLAFIRRLPAADGELSLVVLSDDHFEKTGPHLKKWASGRGFIVQQKVNGISLGMLFFYPKAWDEREEMLAKELFDNASIIWNKVKRPTKTSLRAAVNSRKKKLILAAVTLTVLFFPMRTSVTADAAVAAKNAAIVRSGLSGVVESIAVDENSSVTTGDLLLSFDSNELDNYLQIAERELKATQAELSRVSQLAITNREQREQLQVLSQTVETKKAEVALYQDRLSRVDIYAQQSGLAIIGNHNDLLGRPVKIGEKLLMIADPNDVELEIFVHVADAIIMEAGTEIKMFLNIAPQEPLNATLTFASYRAEVVPEGYLAFKVKADLSPASDLPRIGLRGTARIYGKRSPLIMHVLRKPLASLRQWMGI